MKKPNSALKHMNTKDLMEKYYQQIENAVYSAEITCCNNCNNETVKQGICILCAFSSVHGCKLPLIRSLIGNPVNQDDIITCESSEDVIGEEKERLK